MIKETLFALVTLLKAMFTALNSEKNSLITPAEDKTKYVVTCGRRNNKIKPIHLDIIPVQNRLALLTAINTELDSRLRFQNILFVMQLL